MSRIYDALKKAEEGKRDSILVAIEESQVAGTEEQLPEWTGPLREEQRIQEPQIEELCPEAEFEGALVEQRTGYRSVRVRVPAGAPIFPFDGSDAQSSEQYRILRTNLLQHPARPRIIAVSSAGPGDGKTISAINAAGVLALKNDASVLLVDADMRRGSIASLLGLDPSPGLSEVLRGECRLEEAVVRLQELPNLCVLPGGRALSNPAELLDSGSWKAFCTDVRELFRFTIMDTTPIAVVADFDLVQVVCDGVMVVVRPDHTDRNLCTKALKAVPKEKMLGVLVNCVEGWFLWKTHSYY